jgi:hypothetical protein
MSNFKFPVENPEEFSQISHHGNLKTVIPYNIVGVFWVKNVGGIRSQKSVK